MPTPARVPVETPTRALEGSTAAYVIGERAGLLVDPGECSAALDDIIRECHVEHVTVTHNHPDHVGAVATYAEEFDLTVWARAGRTAEFAAATECIPDRVFRPGTSIPTGDNGVEVVDIPGHAPEHVAFVVDEGWLVGDLAVATGSVVVGAPEGDMRAYLTSLRRVLANAPDRLFPAHGPVIENPGETCERLIAHRLDRERRICEAVCAGTATPAALVDAVYDKDISAVRSLAEATVVAHLEKLAVEGAISWDGATARSR